MKRLVLAITIATAALVAQPQPQPQPQGPPDSSDTGDAPDHGVARISFINGNASVRRGDSGELVDAALNAPLSATDRLETSEGSRAEVQFDSANLIRLGPSTEIRLGELAYGHVQVQVAVGTASFRVLRDSNDQVEISTPSVSVRPARKGTYRVTVRPDGTSEITVRSGDAEIFSPRGSEPLQSGRTMEARGTASDPEFQVNAEVPQDDLDRWAASRDQNLERASSPRYVSPDVTGTEDLDSYGRWTNDPQYGDVWVPQVDPNWAPYRCGRWVWMDFYGWTWVGCEPWAWAPYHYGNWYQGSFGWAWYPGPIHSRYYWRPAMVGFFGWGGAGGIGFGFGNVGWVPLAPYERFHPWYGRGFRGTSINNVNIVNNTNIVNVYRNARFNNGITSVRAGDFGRTGISNGNFVRTSAADISQAGMVRGQLPLSPARESNQFSNRAPVTRGLPRTNDNMRFFSRNPTSAGQGTSQIAPRSFGNPGANSGGPVNSGVGNGSNGGGWRRFDSTSQRPVQGGSVQNGAVQGGRPGFQGGSPQVNNGGFSGRVNDGSFQRREGASRGELERRPASEAPARSYTPPQQQQPQYNRDFSRPQVQPRESSPQQPVRISPPIVQNRGGGGNGGGGGARGGEGPRGGGQGGGSRGGGGGGHHR